MTEEQYNLAKLMYVEQQKSLTYIAKTLHVDRGKLSKQLKADNVKIINKQNLTKFNQDVFEVIDTEEKAYWLGFLYADGYVGADNNIIELSLKSSDIQHLKKFKKFLEFDENKTIFCDSVRCRLNFRNKKLKNDLIKLGCTPRKSLTLTFPNSNQLPNHLLLPFTRGYVDGDGSVMIGHRNVPRLNVLGTHDFLTSLVENNGWKQNKIRYKNRDANTGVCSIEWCGKYVMQYLDLLYEDANIYLDRKYEKYQLLKAMN